MDRAPNIRDKARVNHPRVGGTLGLLASQRRGHVSIATIQVGILELWYTLVPVISGMFIDSVYSSLPHHGLRELVSAPRRCTSPYYFMTRLDGPGHGSRSRPGLTSRDFKDLGGCLRHHTSDRACR